MEFWTVSYRTVSVDPREAFWQFVAGRLRTEKFDQQHHSPRCTGLLGYQIDKNIVDIL